MYTQAWITVVSVTVEATYSLAYGQIPLQRPGVPSDLRPGTEQKKVADLDITEQPKISDYNK